MIEKLSPHYSYTTPASVHDEEALTALELAGRHGAKINEIIDDQNMLRETTEGTLAEFKNKTIPSAIESNIQEKLEDGTFDDAFNQYAGDLEGRLNHLIGSVPEGGTTMDAEIIDARLGENGVQYASLGVANREQFKALGFRNRNYCIGATTEGKARIAFDVSAGTITVKPAIYCGHYLYIQVPAETTIEFNYSSTADCYNVCVSRDDGSLYVRTIREAPANRADVILCTFFLNAGKIMKVWGYANTLKMVSVNGVPYQDDVMRGTRTIIGQHQARFELDTAKEKITISGFLFFDKGNYFYTAGASASYKEFSFASKGETLRLVIDADGALKWRRLVSYMEGDAVLGLFWFQGDRSIQKYNIYTDESLAECVYLNGEKTRSATVTVNNHTCNIFRKVVCCGDSFTAGHIYNKTTGVSSDHTDFAWPAFMGSLTGNRWENAGVSGSNAYSWLTGKKTDGTAIHSHGFAEAQAFGQTQAYVVGLMINDQTSGTLSLPLGTESDIGTGAMTYYGSLPLLIENLFTISADAHVFVCTCPQTSGQFPQYNAAVYKIVDQMRAAGKKVHLLDLLNNLPLYQTDSIRDDLLNYHYTAVGYEQFAEAMQHIMSDYINNHVTEFQDVAFIKYD